MFAVPRATVPGRYAPRSFSYLGLTAESPKPVLLLLTSQQQVLSGLSPAHSVYAVHLASSCRQAVYTVPSREEWGGPPRKVFWEEKHHIPFTTACCLIVFYYSSLLLIS